MVSKASSWGTKLVSEEESYGEVEILWHLFVPVTTSSLTGLQRAEAIPFPPFKSWADSGKRS